IVRAFPHDASAFTEGLLYLDGKLYESTGMEGRSSIREVRLEDGKVLRQAVIPPHYFGEGLVNWGDRLISVTWRHGVGFIWDR
ncbi:glutaminyl-peptide cyclotransferase, partial [Salmonella enterica subsp. enterica serovar Typhimurium]|nr:glutaminyl-peptide cyclotransferase [Salmonella enterica subsp. enterica serovar Typhimurium]